MLKVSGNRSARKPELNTLMINGHDKSPEHLVHCCTYNVESDQLKAGKTRKDQRPQVATLHGIIDSIRSLVGRARE